MEIIKPTTININVKAGRNENSLNQECISNYPWPWPFPISFPFPIPTSGIPIFMKGQETGNGIISTVSMADLFEVTKIITEIKVENIKKVNSGKELDLILKPVFAKHPSLKGKVDDIYSGNGEDGEIMGLFWAGFVAGVLVGMAAQKAYDYFTEDSNDDDNDDKD